METATKRTHCPNCGARLPEQPLSICSYCAMPLDLAAGSERAAQSPNAGTILKIAEQEGFAAAMQRKPHEGPTYQTARRRAKRGRILLVVGLLVAFLGGFLSDWTSLLSRPVFVAGCLTVLVGLSWSFRGARAMRAATGQALLRRPALILDRRSDTALEGWWGHTVYHFKFEFADGSIAEYSYPGRGASEDLYVNGMTGIAYTRGGELLEFEHIRV